MQIDADSEKEARGDQEPESLSHPTTREENLLPPTAKRTGGRSHQAFWRTEPEIGPARQEQLARCLATTADRKRSSYPFKELKLSRADVEWLLVTHEKRQDSRSRGGKQKRCRGLDVRGADLRNADLHALPLACLCGSLTHEEWDEATTEQRTAATVLLAGADLSEAHLEEAELSGVHLEKVSLRDAHLEKANLAYAHLEWAFLARARLKEADLREAHLEKADLSEVHLEGAYLRWTHLEQAYLNSAHLEQAYLSRARLEEYETAVRANRQLAVALRAQGLDEEAARFAYRAQLLQRIVFWRQGKFGSYAFSVCLDLLAGYGYKPGRSLIAYLVVVFGFMGLYLLNTHGAAVHLSWDEALVLSVSSFHGRGFFFQSVTLGDAFARLAAVEAVLGLLIEISFIATFTQRFFGR